jgi:hypothetical protein
MVDRRECQSDGRKTGRGNEEWERKGGKEGKRGTHVLVQPSLVQAVAVVARFEAERAVEVLCAVEERSGKSGKRVKGEKRRSVPTHSRKAEGCERVREGGIGEEEEEKEDGRRCRSARVRGRWRKGQLFSRKKRREENKQRTK